MQVSKNPPPGSADDEGGTPSYIGVPSNYRPNRSPLEFFTNPFKPPSKDEVDAYLAPPKYFTGDESRPAAWGEERVVDLQSQMVDAGILKSTAYQRGVWDIATANAYEKLLATSNAAGLDYTQTLSNYRAVISKYGRPGDQEKSAERQPFISQRRDPEALRALLGNVAGKIMGGPLSKEEEDNFISTFNSMSESAQRAAYVASGSGGPGGPGGVDQEIDPEAQASKFLRETRPQDVVQHDVINRFNQFQDLLSKYS